jgi:hypothetical protein
MSTEANYRGGRPTATARPVSTARRMAMAILRLLGAISIVLVANVATTQPAAARDFDNVTRPNLCTASAPDVGVTSSDGAFPHICTVALVRPGPYQASTGEWVLFPVNIGGGTKEQCLPIQSSVVVTISLSGQSVPVDTLPCYFGTLGLWSVSYRFLSHPLPAGTYTASLTVVYLSDVFDGVTTTPAGTVQHFTQTLTVVQHG